MPRGMNRWFFALGVFLMAGGWGAMEFVKEQTRVAANAGSSSFPISVWNSGFDRQFASGKSQPFYPGRAIFLGGGLSFVFGAGLAALALFPAIQERRRPQPEQRDHE